MDFSVTIRSPLLGSGFFAAHPFRLRDGESPLSLSLSKGGLQICGRQQGLWTVYGDSAQIPIFGWKIHVGATRVNASAIFADLGDYLRTLADPPVLKHIRSLAIFNELNQKGSDRLSAGKLVTIYPRDDDHLADLLIDMQSVLDGYESAYILTDLRYLRGPLYVRYGAFRPNPSTGTLSIEGPDHTWLPDPRQVNRYMPDWIDAPRILAYSLEERRKSAEFPFQVQEALQITNAGGVYRARRANGDTVILKEGRPGVAIDSDYYDATEHLSRAVRWSETLNDERRFPRLTSLGRVQTHWFAMQRHVRGRTLLTEAIEKYPLVWPDATSADVAAYKAWCAEMMSDVRSAITAAHRRGVALVDIHPRNIVVEDGRAVFIDFEHASLLCDPPATVGAPGFVAPSARTGAEADEFALDRLDLFLKWPNIATASLDERFAVLAEENWGLVSEDIGSWASRVKERSDIVVDAREWARQCILMGDPGGELELFPGGAGQYTRPDLGAIGMGHGALGILAGATALGLEVPRDLLAWATRAVRRLAQGAQNLSLSDGLSGWLIGCSLLGLQDEALMVNARIQQLIRERRWVDLSLGTGLAGVVDAQLRMASLTGDADSAVSAVSTARLLARESAKSQLGDGGLWSGPAGVAWSLMRAAVEFGDADFTAPVASLLRQDMDRLVEQHGGLFLLKGGNRHMPYVEHGSVGLLWPLLLYRQICRSDEFDDVIRGIIRCCNTPFVFDGGVLRGRAGLLLGLIYAQREGFECQDLITGHRSLLSSHVVRGPNGYALAGSLAGYASLSVADGLMGAALSANEADCRDDVHGRVGVTPLWI